MGWFKKDGDTPRVPDGWVVSPTADGASARKWFGDHYKEVAVADENGEDALYLACDAVDKEAALRA